MQPSPWTKQPEAVLPVLEVLTDLEQSRQYFMSRMRVAAPAYRDLQIQACRPQIAHHKPASRCTIVYPLDYAPETDVHQSWPHLVVAKTYRNENGYNAHESRRVLFDALELFILILHAWTKVKVRELKDIMFVLEYFLLAYMIPKVK